MENRGEWRRILAGISFLAIVMLLFPLLSRSASAQSSPSQPNQGSSFTLEGKINDLKPGKLTVSTQDNIIFHVTFDDKTEIHAKDGSAASAKDLAAGEQIKVQGELTPEGVIKAHRIDLE